MKNYNYEKYIGLRSGRLVILRAWRDNERGETLCECRCDCGNVITGRVYDVKHGRMRSCGCRGGNHKHDLCGTRVYRIWQAMKNRCRNKNAPNYKFYGGRGIRYCPEWEDFNNFLSWAKSNGYRDDLSIDRIDCDGDYCPENCRWATMEEQQANKRKNYSLIFNGEKVCLRQYCALVGVSYTMLTTRLKRKKTTITEIQEFYGKGTNA